jgi:hypothetical protein
MVNETGPRFRLLPKQLTPDETRSKILALACAYCRENDGAAKDANALRAGSALLSSTNIQTNLKTIVDWKLESFRRFKPERLLEKNSKEEIADALRLAADAKTDRSGIAVLIGLSGVGIPVASAILTAMFAIRYTVIDKRALASLDHPTNEGTIGFYLQYLAECRRLAGLYDVEQRALDRALWQWRLAKISD